MFASVVDMEPGMWFRTHRECPPLEWLGVERVVSRFPGKHRVRVLVGRGGVSFVADAARRFQVVEFRERR